ncbi:hypothetical protein D3C83_131740 [compost metagenome]
MQDAAYRLRDLAGAQHRGRNLIKKRLKNVMILTINQHDIDRLIREGFCGPKPAKPTADYHNFFLIAHQLPIYFE